MAKESCNAEIISVGTEILLGHVVNADAKIISEMLSGIGINMRYHTVVGDNYQRMKQCVDTARDRSDIIITTGGLGPTCDDLTKTVISEVFDAPLVNNPEEEKILREYTEKRGYSAEMTENHLRQAYLPDGSVVFHNQWGIAPGCMLEKDGVTVIMVPGPPRECQSMFQTYAIPYLRKYSGETIVSHTINLLGIAESRVDQIFRDEMVAMSNPTMAPYARVADCFLKITAKAENEEEAESLIEPVMSHCCERLNNLVYGIDVDCVEEIVIPLLAERGMTIAIAEECTAGEISRRVVNQDQGRNVLRGSITVENMDTFSKVAQVPLKIREIGKLYTVDSTNAMAKSVRKMFGVDMGIGITAIDTKEKEGENELGTIFLSVAVGNELYHQIINAGTRRTKHFIDCMAGNYAFDMVRRILQNLPIDYS